MIGTFSFDFSNHWNFFRQVFQSLETFFELFPIVGTFFRDFSNRWKLFLTVFQALESPENGGGRWIFPFSCSMLGVAGAVGWWPDGLGGTITKKAFFSRPPLSSGLETKSWKRTFRVCGTPISGALAGGMTRRLCAVA
jgi:hypothetical protein